MVNEPAFQTFLTSEDGEELIGKIDFVSFIKKYIHGGWGNKSMSLTVYFTQKQDPEAQRNALAKAEAKRGAIQTEGERNQHLEQSFEPSWYEKY